MERKIESPMLTTSEAAKYMRIDVNTLSALLDMGEIPVLNLGSKKIYRPVLDEFIVKNMTNASDTSLKKLVENYKNQKKLKPGERRIEI
ncbi:helix-turn-helix domain-containing protein [Lactobacillus sp. 3B(2020)]|uniref:helix-turn-helix domain-containing protein n=1 Tax=Lactobacillus sp. 3B(2020) TaxID=2695882 RepID=UPI0015DF4C99|nr:helix-turn-helix domain-containing protein [Lactobacillus sp. 3B(2020)]QLL70251.1 helix-turn-helix domain-containing protein [Lactobacillus sp. 3B(2020)]